MRAGEYNLVVMRDITERLKAQSEFDTEVARRRVLVEQSRDGVVIMDLTGAVREANEAYAHMLGYTLGEVHQLHIWDWDADIGKEDLLAMLEGVGNTGEDIRTRHRRKDGTVIDVEISSIGEIVGGEKLVFNLCRDVTERKKMEESLRMTQYSVDHAVEEILWLDENGRIMSANDAACEKLGYTHEEIVSLTARDLDPTVPEDWNRVWGALKEKGALTLETTHRTKDGQEFAVEVQSSLMEYEGREYNLLFAHDISDRKSLEESLRLTQFSVDQSGDQIFWLTPKGRFVHANDATCDQLGYTRDELLNTNIREVASGVKEDWKESWEELKREGSLTSEQVYRSKDGRQTPVEVRSRHVEWAGREYEIVFAHDITSRKKMEERLRLTQLSVDQAADQTFWITPEGQFVFVNDATCDQLGYTREELLSMTVFDVDPTLPKGWTGGWEELKRRGSLTHEAIHRTKDGRDIPMEIRASYVKQNGNEYNFVSARDISGRKTMEESLRLTQISVNRAGDQVLWIDPEGRIVFVNDAACEQLGYTREELLALTVYDLDHTLPRPWTGEWLRIKEQGSILHEAMHRTKNGVDMPVEVNATYVEYEGREYNFVFARDITERKKADNALRIAKDKAEAANRELEHSIKRTNQLAVEAQAANEAKSAFLANMSHEIRTPMNGVIGMVDLLLDTELNPEQRDYAETVQSSAEALLTVIGDILDFSKVEAKKLEFENIDFDLRLTLEDMMAILAIKAHEKGVELAVLVEPDVPSALCGDPGRLRQVLTNLVGNAIKFTEEGEVDVHVILESEDDQGAVMRFVVRDSGIGIPEAVLEQLFHPFVQADASTTRRYGGSGLGLSIAKGLVEAMGGQLGAESTVGVGSTFWFSLPLSKGTPIPSEYARMELGSVAGVRVLGVDDSETNRKVMAGMLDSWGCRHSEVPGAKEALVALRQAVAEGDPYRVAVLDMCMPDIDGEELAIAIKADPELAATGLVMMTSVGARGDAARMEKVGFSAYLVKPVRQSHFYDCLAAVVGPDVREGDGGERPTAPARIITRHTLAERARRRACILLAEDNLTNQKVALKALEKLGYQADVANDGAQALQATRDKLYDLVLMDVQMPGMDGMEATRQIRDPNSGTLNPSVVIVALTAHAMSGDRQRCLDNGMDDYLAKPIKAAELQEVISKWMSATPPGAESEAIPPALKVSERPVRAVFDEKVLLNLLEGDRESAGEIADQYLADVAGQVTRIREAIEVQDAVQTRERAHALKGSSASVGAEALRYCAGDLEKLAAAGDVTSNEVAALAADLEHQLNLLLAFAEEKGGRLM